jgi:OOP family OmpA-OmpF porin
VTRRCIVGLAALATASGSFALAGCAGSQPLQARIDAAAAIVHEADENGAYACAPREMALARAHLRFAAAALRRGELAAARDHLAIAEPNARAARSESPPVRCEEPARVARLRDEAGLARSANTGDARDDVAR